MQQNFFKNKFYNYWINIDRNILFCFILLFFLGLFFSFSSTSSLAGERLDKDNYFFFTKHLVFMFLSILIMFTISFVDISILQKLVFPLFIICLILLFLVPFIGIEVKGAKRWLSLYYFRLQPVELIKPFFVLVTAKILSSNLRNNKAPNSLYILSFFILATIVILLINQPDLGQSILIISTWIAIVFISGFSLIYISGISLGIATFVSSLIIIFPQKFGYITQRLTTFIDPSKGDSFQTEKALEAIRQGGLKGQGMGEGILKDSVPEAHTDYIIAIVSEEFGSLLSTFIIFIFIYISFKIIKNCLKETNENLKISLCGLASLLIFQTFIHIGVNTSLLPTTGMTLPFLSYGGSSLIGSAILAGVILNYTKNRVLNE